MVSIKHSKLKFSSISLICILAAILVSIVTIFYHPLLITGLVIEMLSMAGYIFAILAIKREKNKKALAIITLIGSILYLLGGAIFLIDYLLAVIIKSTF